jgi:hypothetical protein
MKNRSVLLFSFALVLVLCIGFLLIHNLKLEKASQEKERLNQIFYSNADCTVPCWQGLIPGQSRANEYQLLTYELEEKGFTFSHGDSGENYNVYSWVDPESELYLLIYVDEENIQKIRFASNNLGKTENIFEVLGEPDYYASSYIKDIEAVISLDLIYPDKGVVINISHIEPSEITDNCNLNLETSRSHTVPIVDFVKAQDAFQMLRDSGKTQYLAPNFVQEWTGLDAIHVYGCVQ